LKSLLVDIGNTRIKWARCVDGRIGAAHAGAHSSWRVSDLERRLFPETARFDRVVISSVATRVTRKVTAAARRSGAPPPEVIETRRNACGVTMGYVDPWRLGVDRFMAIIAAHQRFRHRPVCVVAVGTAMTIDLVGADGRHRGGAIIPGPTLMKTSLLDGTSGIRRRARGGSKAGGRGFALFGRSTCAAIEQGTRFAAAAAVDRAVSEARHRVRRAPLVVLTGGGAAAIEPLIRSAHVEVPDLVLQGLAAYTLESSNPTN
jgi:type III pantothenate kinase